MKLTTINIRNAYHSDLIFTFGGYTFKATDVLKLPINDSFVVLDINEYPALIHEDQVGEFKRLSAEVLNNAVAKYLERMQELRHEDRADVQSYGTQLSTEPIE